MTLAPATSTARLLLVSATLLTWMGCAQSENTAVSLAGADKPCEPMTAQFLIIDGIQETICGCQEPAEVITSGSGTVTCTVAAGTAIFFHYMGVSLMHQIVPTDGVSFPSSMLSDPSDERPVPVHAFLLDAAGTYEYLDAYDPGLTGRIIVQ